MGDQVGQVAYGAMIEKEDYLKLLNHFYNKVHAKYGYGEDEKNDKSVLMVEQPYETYEYLLLVRESKQSSYNGTIMLPCVATHSLVEWKRIVTEFLNEHNITPVESVGWMLTGRYN